MATKTAVDQSTKDYYIQLFGPEIGAQWVKDIPRRVSAALLSDLKRTASIEAARLDEYVVIPLAHHVTGSLIEVEGCLRGVLKSQGVSTRVATLFNAKFNQDGDLIDISSAPLEA